MDPSEMTPVLRELQARDAYCLDRSGMWMAIREVWEDMADDEIAVLRELWGPHCPDDVAGCLVMRFGAALDFGNELNPLIGEMAGHVSASVLNPLGIGDSGLAIFGSCLLGM